MSELFTLQSIHDFLAERKAKFQEELRTRGLNLPSSLVLRQAVKVLGENQFALDHDDLEDEPEVDGSEMSCKFTITTPAKDRYGDVVVPRGCEAHLKNYLKNPQVFFAHKSADIPIAQARNPKTKECSLEVFDDRILATAYFHEETEEARVIWRLIAAGILRATSIGFLPVKASIIGSNKSEEEEVEERLRRKKERTEEGEKVLQFDSWMPLRFLEWDLLEFSVVPVPANPECVDSLTSYLSRGMIEGERIPQSIRKSLEPFALKAKVWSPGFDPSKSKYSGVLMLGTEEIEYDEGKIVRLGEVKMTEEEEDKTVLKDDAEEIIEEAVQTETKTEVLDDLIPATSEEDDKKEDYSAKIYQCLLSLETHLQSQCSLLSDLGLKFETLTQTLKDLSASKPEPEPVKESVEENSKEWEEVLNCLQALDARQNKLNETLFSLTGRSI